MTVWVLALYGHRLHLCGVFSSYEKAVESAWEDNDEERDEYDDIPEGYHLEGFMVE